MLADGKPAGSLDASRTPVRLGISGMLTGELTVPVGVTARSLTLRIGTSLLSASALSYLGLGVSPPAADWGVMISDARTYFRSYPIMIIAPGLGITLFSLGINLTGDALCELLSIKKRSANKEF